MTVTPLSLKIRRRTTSSLLFTATIAAAFLSRFDWLGLFVFAAIAFGCIWLSIRRIADVSRVFVQPPPRVGSLALPLFVVSILGCLIVGSFPLDSSMASFLSAEGRNVASLLPLIAVALLGAPAEPADYRLLAISIRVLAGLSGLLATIWLLFDVEFLGDGNDFWGLTSSHHVPGLLAGVAIIGSLSLLAHEHRPLDAGLAISASLALFASSSRTSLLALVIAVLWYAAFGVKGSRHRGRMIGIISIAALAAIIVVPRAQETVGLALSPDFRDRAFQAFDQESSEGLVNQWTSVAEANILSRFGIWGTSWEAFSDSPFVGIGPWRVNDNRLTYWGKPGVLLLAVGGERDTSDFGAHNVVLQALAETGVLGLALVATFVVATSQAVHTVDGRPVWFAHFSRMGFAFWLATIPASVAMFSPALIGPMVVVFAMNATMQHQTNSTSG